MKVSVVTCAFNRELQAKRGLLSILRQDILPDEIVVVDDGSTDNLGETIKSLQNQFPQVAFVYIYLTHPEHRISSIPRNVGFKNSTGDIVLFTEPECLHVGNTIKQIVDLMEQNPDRTILASQVWTIQRKIYQKLSEDNFRRPATILNHEYAQLTDNVNLQNTKAPDSDWAITGQNNCAAGCLFGLRREWFEKVGGFNEEFVGHGGDDFDLYERLALIGHGILKSDDIIVIHQWHEKNYPYNIYEMANHNMSISATMTKSGEYEVNKGKNWGVIDN